MVVAAGVPPPLFGDDAGRPADAGAELGVPMPWVPSLGCKAFGPEDDAGVHSPSCDMADSRLGAAIGRNKSRVRSKISEPMAPMAEEYLSRRILDSLTIRSANMRTRSASVGAAASLAAKARNRSTAAAANCSAVWATTRCLDTGPAAADGGGREASRGLELDVDRVWGGGVGSAFSATDCCGLTALAGGDMARMGGCRLKR